MVRRVFAQHLAERPLRRRGGREGVVLVHLAKLGGERGGGNAVPHLPPRAVVRLAEARHHKGARGQRRRAQHALVAPAVEDDVFVDLVGDHEEVVFAGERGKARDVVHRPDGARRVMRRVDDDEPRPRCHRRRHGLPVHGEVRRTECHVHASPARHQYARLVAVVARVEHDDFVARLHHRHDGVEDRLGGPAGDRDFRGRIGAVPVVGFCLGGDGLAQCGQAGHGGVLVLPLADGARQQVTERLGNVEVGKALPQVHRAGVRGELRHHGEDRGADVRESAGEGWHRGEANAGRPSSESGALLSEHSRTVRSPV